jgi:hypothetical protein
MFHYVIIVLNLHVHIVSKFLMGIKVLSYRRDLKFLAKKLIEKMLLP